LQWRVENAQIIFSPVQLPKICTIAAKPGDGLKIIFDEMNGHGGGVREPYRFVQEWLGGQKPEDLARKRTEAEALFRRTVLLLPSMGMRPPASVSFPLTSFRVF
jgi:uncharacterized circularly permuted ATP-grasp superfamily protein